MFSVLKFESRGYKHQAQESGGNERGASVVATAAPRAGGGFERHKRETLVDGFSYNIQTCACLYTYVCIS